MFKLQSVLLTFTWLLSYNADFVFVISLFALTLFLYLQHRLYWIWIQRLFYPITLFTFLEAISALWGKDCGTSKTKLVLCPQTTIILFAKECLRGCSMIYGFWWVPMPLFETVGIRSQKTVPDSWEPQTCIKLAIFVPSSCGSCIFFNPF